ncbi:MAG: hypothetical protein KGL39_32500 [Patescibacteria group bacterium]|nr:hypothetical protein [Patescibacteria group bacterium]
MRDGTIEAKLAISNAKQAERMALALLRVEWVHKRQRAMEDLMKASALWQRIVWAISPATFLKAVDALHAVRLQEAQRKIEAAEKIQRPKGLVSG